MRKAVYIFLFLAGIFNSFGQALSNFIVVDQFGYRTKDEKIAVIRDPQTGYDAAQTFTPGTNYALVNARTNQQVFNGNITAWNGGATDAGSGDKAWWFDFSSFTTMGSYYVLDVTRNVRSFEFDIRDDVYDDVLKHAFRTFFYQRVGFAKQAPFAETGWTDGASHIGPLQDKNCRLYSSPSNASTEKDVSGGWYDAGDYNKYTTWTANYIYEMLQAYEENPKAWTDDYDLPESGNGRPDILDEVKWGLDHLLRLQHANGSMIAVVGLSHASPPSAAKGQSLYGGVNTSSTWSSAGAFAYASKVFAALGETAYANTCKQAAERAWTWAEANPNVIWRNNDGNAPYNSAGVGSGQQEIDDYGRFAYKMRAAAHLFEITNTTSYKSTFESNYTTFHMIAWPYVYPYETREQQTLLYYTTMANVSASVVNNIKNRYKGSIEGSEINLPAYNNKVDPYMAYLDSYTWGSNGIKGNQGSNLYAIKTYGINSTLNATAEKAAQKYIHYIHGVNPLNMTYLTNMYGKGAEKCANQLYHTWFHDGTALWDEVGVSTYGPAPGFLSGGPNPSYDWDGCCPSGCGSSQANAVCTSLNITPPKNQPKQKSYLDFNTTWPLNSWSVTENSCGYQMSYIRLLSKFVDRSSIISSTSKETNRVANKLTIFPNPATTELVVGIPKDFQALSLSLVSAQGREVVRMKTPTGTVTLKLPELETGIYFISVNGASENLTEKIVIE